MILMAAIFAILSFKEATFEMKYRECVLDESVSNSCLENYRQRAEIIEYNRSIVQEKSE
jgi:hypothetical protein